jgi:hypothetical protein
MRDNGNAIITNSSSGDLASVTRGSTLRLTGGESIAVTSSEGAVVTTSSPHTCAPTATNPGLCTPSP